MRRALRLLLALICILSLLTGCAQQEREWDRRPMVLVKGTIYLDTGKQIPVEVHESAVSVSYTHLVNPKSTRDTQGVAVMTLKKNHFVASVKPFKEGMVENSHRFRTKTLPAAGALLRAQDKGEQLTL